MVARKVILFIDLAVDSTTEVGACQVRAFLVGTRLRGPLI